MESGCQARRWLQIELICTTSEKQFCCPSGRPFKTRAMLQHSLAVVAPGCPISSSSNVLGHRKWDQSWGPLCPALLWGCGLKLSLEGKAPPKTSLIHVFLRCLVLFFNIFLENLACLKDATKISLQNEQPRVRCKAGRQRPWTKAYGRSWACSQD